MKYTNIKSFESHLRESSKQHLMDLYLICDKEDFTCRLLVKHIVTLSDLGQPKVLLGEDVSLATLETYLFGMSLFTDKEIVIIHQIHKLKKPILDALARFLDHPNPGIRLILTCRERDQHLFFKKAEKAGVILDLLQEKPWEKEERLAKWIEQSVRSAKKNMTYATAMQLVKRIGPTQGLISGEIEKLICYVNARIDITIEDVKVLSSIALHDTVWKVGNYLLEGALAKALKVVDYLFNQGLVLPVFVATLRHQFQNSYQLLSLKEEGKSYQEIEQSLPKQRGKFFIKNLQLAEIYSHANLKQALMRIHEIEVQSREIMSNPRAVSELLCIQIAKIGIVS